MNIGVLNLSQWTRQRYQIFYEGSAHGSYTAWDIIRLFDEGHITEDTMLVEVGCQMPPTPFKEDYLFKHKDELRALGSPLGQAVMIDLLTKIRVSLLGLSIGIGVWMLLYLIFGYIPTAAR